MYQKQERNKPRNNNTMKTAAEKNTFKARILDFGTFNNWKGYIGLYFTKKELRTIKKYVPDFDNMTMKQIYNAL